MKSHLFQSYGHCQVFQIYWHTECSTFIASSFRICNSSTGIPSPTLALFIVILPKAHLTFHSRMSGSKWVITTLWLSGLWRSFLYSSSVYSWHLFLVSSAYLRSTFLFFIVPIFACDVSLVSLIYLNKFEYKPPWYENAALNMPPNLENSAVATGLEKVSFHSSPRERQWQRMLKLMHRCTHLTH